MSQKIVDLARSYASSINIHKTVLDERIEIYSRDGFAAIEKWVKCELRSSARLADYQFFIETACELKNENVCLWFYLLDELLSSCDSKNYEQHKMFFYAMI